MNKSFIATLLEAMGWKASGLEPVAEPPVETQTDDTAPPAPDEPSTPGTPGEPRTQAQVSEPETETTPAPEPTELETLVTEFGGVKGIRTLLTDAQNIVKQQADVEAVERSNLVATITQNTAMEEADLEGMGLAVLRKLAQATNVPVSYGLTNSVIPNADADDAGPPVPPGLLIASKKEETNG